MTGPSKRTRKVLPATRATKKRARKAATAVTASAEGSDSRRATVAGLEARITRGGQAHYEDAVYYDLAYKRRRQDVRFYVEIAQELGSPVLELGVGTGRVALALAQAGIEVHGVDPAQAMLDHAATKLLTLPKAKQSYLTLKRGDARNLRLQRRFPLITAPFNVFMHLYTLRDLERALATVRAHLTPRGRFVFDVLTPDLRAMVRRPGRLLKAPMVIHPLTGRRYHYLEAFEYDSLRQVQMVSMIFQDADGAGELKIVPLSQRQFFPQELEALLHYNGFTIEERWGDFTRAPFSDESESQIIVAKLRAK